MNFEKFRDLTAHHRALVAIAVLLDGHEAAMYLGNDTAYGQDLSNVASSIASLDPNFRNLLAGHHLRSALNDLAIRIRSAEGEI